MKSITSKALVALLATSLCLGGAWAASAQSAAPAPDAAAPGASAGSTDGNQGQSPNAWPMHPHRQMGQMQPGWRMGGMQRGMENWGMGMRGRLMSLVCSPRGAEAIDIAFVRLSYRLNLTGDQQPLFDALKTTALDQQKSFAQACQSARPTAGQRPDALEMMKDRISLETAKLAAMNAVLPKFEALYASLNDQQKAALMPGRGGGFGHHRQGFGPRANGPGSNREAPYTMPGRPAPNTIPGSPGSQTPGTAPAPQSDTPSAT